MIPLPSTKEPQISWPTTTPGQKIYELQIIICTMIFTIFFHYQLSLLNTKRWILLSLIPALWLTIAETAVIFYRDFMWLPTLKSNVHHFVTDGSRVIVNVHYFMRGGSRGILNQWSKNTWNTSKFYNLSCYIKIQLQDTYSFSKSDGKPSFCYLKSAKRYVQSFYIILSWEFRTKCLVYDFIDVQMALLFCPVMCKVELSCILNLTTCVKDILTFYNLSTELEEMIILKSKNQIRVSREFIYLNVGWSDPFNSLYILPEFTWSKKPILQSCFLGTTVFILHSTVLHWAKKLCNTWINSKYLKNNSEKQMLWTSIMHSSWIITYFY